MNTVNILNEKASNSIGNKQLIDSLVKKNHGTVTTAKKIVDSYANLGSAEKAVKTLIDEYTKMGRGYFPHVKALKSTLIEINKIKVKEAKKAAEIKAAKPKKTGSRESNEATIKAFMEKWRTSNKVNHIKMDFKGTKLTKGAFSDLKRDEQMKIPGIPSFNFEAKKGDPGDLTKGGVLFAESDKIFHNSKKEDLLKDPKKLEKIKNHNEKLKKLYTPEIMKEIQKELGRKNENKPYLFIGGDTPESIRVVYPYQYWIDTNLKSSYLPDRFEMRAKAKPKTKVSELLTLPEFFNRMMVESKAEDFSKEIING